MRIFTAILSAVVAILLYDLSDKISILARLTSNEDMSAAAGGALIAALLFVVAGGLVYFFPLVAAAIYLGTFPVLMFSQWIAGIDTDMMVYMWAGPILAVTSFFGWRGKVQVEKEKQRERIEQQQRDMLLRQMVYHQQKQSGMPPTAN